MYKKDSKLEVKRKDSIFVFVMKR